MKKVVFIIVLSILAFGSYQFVYLIPKVSIENDEIKESDKMFSCEEVLPSEYVQFMLDGENGMIKQKQLDDFVFKLQFITGELKALKELGADNITKPVFDESLNRQNDLQYFNFQIVKSDYVGELLKYNIKSEKEYTSRIEYFSFNMQKDIKLIDGIDTLDCELFHFERTFSISPYLTFSLGFRRIKGSANTKQFCYTDNIFNNGKICMAINRSDILKIPRIKLN